MKKQINPTIKAHLIRSAFYVLVLLAVTVSLEIDSQAPKGEFPLQVGIDNEDHCRPVGIRSSLAASAFEAHAFQAPRFAF